jgi:hypothetical protein
MSDKYSYIGHHHVDRKITTVELLLNSDLFYAEYGERINKLEFLNFKAKRVNLDGKIEEIYDSNLDLIWREYDSDEKELYKVQYSTKNLSLLKPNTILYIPVKDYNPELIPIRGKNLFVDQGKEMTPYFSERQKQLERDEYYVKVEQVTQKGRNIDVQTIEQNCQVWIYSKTLEKIVDISPFIQSLEITKQETGSFSFTLSPISGIINRANNNENFDLQKVFGTDYINEYNLLVNGKFNVSFFDKYFQQNDVVFIRFEKLKLEQDNVVKSGLEVSKLSLPDQIFDMIGLVDSVNSSLNCQTTDYVININGRDLTKTIIEDGQYLMSIIFVQGETNQFFYGGNPNDKFFKRNYAAQGAFEYMFTKQERRSIEDSIAFVINQISNIGWTSNELFSAYQNKTEAYSLSNISDKQTYLKTVETNGVWQITKLKVDPQIKDRRILNDTMFDIDGTLQEFFKNICQSPFVEIWGDTYGSRFEYIVRQPPFDKKGMMSIVENESYITIENKDVYQINLGWETEYYSWMKFIPSSNVFGKDETFYEYAFPIIYMEKFIEHFGNHKLYLYDQYIPESSMSGGNETEDINITAQALFNDLKYALEVYSVLPFTRTGTIVMNGDRRIKRGSFVYLKATNEICYVDGVSNSVSFNRQSVDRVTTLSVKRCMIKDFIKGSYLGSKGGDLDQKVKRDKEEIEFRAKFRVFGTEEKDTAFGGNIIGDTFVTTATISYYDIVNSEVITKDLLKRIFSKEMTGQISTKNIKNTQVDFSVNETVFDFFLKRKQMG